MTETATQRIERIKRERPSWDILDDIRRWAESGFESIPEDDLSVRMRAWGLYTQGDGLGTRGGAIPFFMMRVRTPAGVLTSEQVRTIAAISTRYARGTLDITNRQNFQLHWLRIEDIPAIWDALSAVGWTSMGSCGDNPRTVTGCPLAGIDGSEITDASALALRVDRHLNGNPEFGNLPRKFKVTVTGCSHWCTYPEINDLAATAVRRGDEIGYHLRVGGGLSTRPHFGKPLNAFIRPDQLIDAVSAVASIFRDSDELRQSRSKARIKFLFLNHGWTAEQFLAEVENRLGYRFEPAAPETIPEGSYRDHVGIHPQRDPGRFYAGFSVLAGRIGPERLEQTAEIAERFGSGLLRTTVMQNIVVVDVPEENVPAVRAAAAEAGLALEGSPFERGTLACTGSEFCKLALTETKGFAARLAQELTTRVADLDADIKIAVTGCPNSCGQHWIADIGLQGIHVKVGGEIAEGYEVFLGGGVGRNLSLARRVRFKAVAPEIAPALHRLLDRFRTERSPGETFREWTNRVPDEGLEATLSGVETPA